MGIWRQNSAQKRPQAKESYSLFENSDPFEFDDSFLGTFKPATPQASNAPQRKPAVTKASIRSTLQSGRPVVAADKDLLDADFSRVAKAQSSRNILKYCVLALALTTTGFALAKYRPWAAWGSPELVYAYFEVRAVDGAGRPVAGASVKNGGKKVGTTDSFGEWRRYMRVPLGATVPITISKATTGEPLYATKNFAVPPEKPEKSDMELRASVQLQTGAAGAVAAAAPTVTAKDANLPKNTPNDTLVGSQTAPITQAPPAVEPKPEPKQEGTAAIQAPHESEVTTQAQASAPSATESSSATFLSSHETVWFEVASAAPNSVLQQTILPTLVQRARELGLRVDQRATWRVRLTSMMEPPRVVGADGGGLIEITTTDQTGTRQFLRNYQSDARMTVKGILYVLSHQVNKNVAVYQKDKRWVAMLPKESSELWRIAGGMSLSGASREWLVGVEPSTDARFRGYFLASSENPCGAGKTNCELKTRSFNDSPAVPSWIRLKMRLTTNSKEKDSVKVFVSGYEARPSGDNLLEYWGQDHAKANVTVIQSGKVVQRLQIVNDLRQPANVALGTASVSRR